MRITINVPYEINGQRRGNATNTSRTYGEDIDVDLREVPSGEAPIGVEWNAAPPALKHGDAADEYAFLKEWKIPPKGGTQHTRWFEGRHWVQCVESDLLPEKHRHPVPTRLEGSPPLTADVLAEACSTNRPPELVGVENPSGKVHRMASGSVPEAEYAFVTHSNRARCVDRVTSWMRTLIAVDGVVYHRCAEPTVIMRSDPDGATGRHFLDITTDASEIQASLRNRKSLYSVSQFEEALSDKALFSTHAVREIDAARAPSYFLDESIDEARLFDALLVSHLEPVMKFVGQLTLDRLTDEMLVTFRPLNAAITVTDPRLRLPALESAIPPFMEAWRDMIITRGQAFYIDPDQIAETVERAASRHITIESTLSPRP